MALSQLEQGELGTITSINIEGMVKIFLQSLGLIEGAEVSIVSKFGGDIILNVSGVRIALDKKVVKELFVDKICWQYRIKCAILDLESK